MQAQGGVEWGGSRVWDAVAGCVRRGQPRRRRRAARAGLSPECLETRWLLALAVPEVLTTEVDGFVGALAVDDSRVYWIEKPGAVGGANGAIRSIAKSGGPITNLLTIAAGRDTRDMALDNTDIYFLTGSNGLSKVSKLGGPETNITNQFGIPVGGGVRRGNNPLDLSFDRGMSRLYVSNLDTQGFGSIQSVSKFGGTVTTLRQADNLGDIIGGRRSVYWFEGDTGQIVSAPLIGGTLHSEVAGVGTGFDGVRVLRTDVNEGLYWGNGDGTVRSFVGGTQTILAADYRSINYNGYASPLVVDDYLGNIYYHSGTTEIRYVPKTGGPSQQLAINTIVAAMAVDNQYLYWATDFGRIRRVPLPSPAVPAPNLAPQVVNPEGGVRNFVQSGPPVLVAPGVRVEQPNWAGVGAAVAPNGAAAAMAEAQAATVGFSGGTVRVSLVTNGSASDVLEISPNGTGPGQVGLSGSTVTYGGVGIGGVSGGTGGTPLVVSLNAAASPDGIRELLRRVTFRTSGGGLSSVVRTAMMEVTNGDGWTGWATQQLGVLTIQGSANRVPMYRAYNPTADYHFFTVSYAEFVNAVTYGYNDESTGRTGFEVLDNLTSTTFPIHRMYNLTNGRHYYTLNDGERDFLVSIGWRFEKEEGFMSATPQPGATEIFRLYNNNSGVHLYTESAAVKDAVLAQFPGIWVQHSSLGYGYVYSFPGVASAFAVVVEPRASSSGTPESARVDFREEFFTLGDGTDPLVDGRQRWVSAVIAPTAQTAMGSGRRTVATLPDPIPGNDADTLLDSLFTPGLAGDWMMGL